MYKIGDFSSMSKTTIKTLRYYEKEGLLKPIFIDQNTGYRYYETSQLVELSKIISLRQIGVSIKDIKSILQGYDMEKILNKRKKELEQLKNVKHTLIFYEAPHRIVDMVNNMKEIFGDRNISISREISKKYEEIYRGKISEVLNEIENIKGEIVVVVEGNHELENFDDIDVIEHVNMFIDDGLSQMEAIKKVAKLRNVPKSEIYNKFHR